MFCRNCGKKLDDDALFCSDCGTKVEKILTAAQAPKAEAQAPKAEAQAPKAEVQAPKAEEAKKEKSKKEKSKKGSKAGVIIVLILLVLAAGGAAGWYLTSPGFVSAQKMKKAAAMLEQEEYKDALKYYSEALEKDDTLVEAYLRSADIYVIQEKQENAIKLLQKGEKKLKENPEAKAQLQAKIKEVYFSQIDSLIAQKQYDQAKEIADQAVEALSADREAAAKRVSIYAAEVDALIAGKDYAFAFDLIDRTCEALGQDCGLSDMRADIYLAMAQDRLDEEDTDEAISLLEEGYDITSNKALLEKEAGIYRSLAEAAFAAGDLNEAAELFGQGADATGDKTLLDRISEIASHVTWDTRYVYNDRGDLTEAVTYDDQDREISSIAYDNSGRVTGATTYEYNDKGMLYKTTNAYYSYGWSGSQSFYTTLYMYTEDGKELGKYYYNTEALDAPSSYEEFVYDQQGNLIVHWFYEGNGESNFRIEMVYDDSHNLLEEHHINNGELSYKMVYSYDSSNNMTSEAVFDRDGNRENYTTYAYDSNGNRTEQCYYYDYYGSGYSRKNTYQYDEKGNLVKDTQAWEGYGDFRNDEREYDCGSANDTCDYVIEYTYDSEDRLIREDANSGQFITSYEYDADGNEIRYCIMDAGDELKAEWICKYNAFGDICYEYWYWGYMYAHYYSESSTTTYGYNYVYAE